jgi:ABC-2 type transport system permease protein
MNTIRIKGMIIRNLYVWVRDLDRVFDAFWWAFFDVVVWGMMSTYFARGNTMFIHQMLAGIIFWSILSRSQWEISSSMLLESWEKNLINIFISPLTVAEYITSSIFLGVAKLCMVICFMGAITFGFYRFNIFTLNFWIIPLSASLFLTSIWSALIINSLILRFGKRVMSFAWTLILIINPASGVVYPITALPRVLQIVSLFLPTSYIFTGAREILEKGTMDIRLLGISFVLNALYIFFGCMLYLRTFKKAREHGWLIKLA